MATPRAVNIAPNDVIDPVANGSESVWLRVGWSVFAGFAATVAVAALQMVLLVSIAAARGRSFTSAFEAEAWRFVFTFALLMWPMVITGGIAGLLRLQQAMLWFAPAVGLLALVAVADHSHGWAALYGLGLGLALGVGFVALEWVARWHAAWLFMALTVTLSAILTDDVTAGRLLVSVLYGIAIGAALLAVGRLIRMVSR